MTNDIQEIQNRHRQALIDYWGIPPSSRVLEIGCGQGDTTRLLARAVGENGFVHAIDPAPGSYGAPTTLADARLQLLSSPDGKNIRMDFETDIFSLPYDKTERLFDYVVLSHCSWYFTSEQLLFNTLLQARKYASKLCFAEWDIRMNSMQQFAHYQATILQAQCNSFEILAGSNIKSLFTCYDITAMLAHAGWNIRKDAVIDSSYLQDGSWEVMITLTEYPDFIWSLNQLPSKTRELLLSNIQVLQAMSKDKVIQSLDTFAILAD